MYESLSCGRIAGGKQDKWGSAVAGWFLLVPYVHAYMMKRTSACSFLPACFYFLVGFGVRKRGSTAAYTVAERGRRRPSVELPL